MKKQICLFLSRKQFVLLIWVVESCIVFLESFSKLDINCNIDELRDFYEMLKDEMLY